MPHPAYAAGFGFFALCLVAGMQSSEAAPILRVERSEGSEISMRPHVIGWGDSYSPNGSGYFFHSVEYENAALADIASGVDAIGAIYADGKARTWNTYGVWTLYNGSPSLSWLAAENVKSLALGNGHLLGIKQDGSLQLIHPGLLGPAPANLGSLSAVAAGEGHAVVLRTDGTVVSWGETNFTNYGQASVPAGLAGVTAIGAGDKHSVALKSDGTVVAWGALPQRQVPSGLSQVKQIAAAPLATVALKMDGSIVAWGEDLANFTPPAGLGTVSQLAAGDRHVAAVKPDGTVAVWGVTHQGHLLPPPGLGEVTAVAAAGDHLAAITPRRIEQYGDVGRGLQLAKTFTIRNTGDAPLALNGITLTAEQGNDFSLDASGMPSQLAPGHSSSFTITFAPATLATGASLLRLATGDPALPELRFAVTGRGINLPPVANDMAVSIPEDSENFEITLAGSDPNGDALEFYVNPLYYKNVGSLGPVQGDKVHFTPTKHFNGTFTFTYGVYDGIPSDITRLSDQNNVVTVTVTPVNDPPFLSLPQGPVVRAAAAGTGAAVSFNVGAGDLEDGMLTPVMRVGGQPVQSGDVFPPGETVVEVSVTDANGLVSTGSFVVKVVEGPFLTVQDEAGRGIRKSGEVVAWGSNAAGQTSVPPGLLDVIAVAGGFEHSLALRDDGRVVAWGSNAFGEATVPTGLQGVKAISSNGGGFNLALKDDGTVAAWGLDSGGVTTIPAGLAGVSAISAGTGHALALKADGTVAAWGNNISGATDVPAGLPALDLIAAGTYKNFVRTGSGGILRWGGGYVAEDVPFPTWLSGVEAISSQSDHTLALRSDGSVVAWGLDFSGESKIPAGLGDVVSLGAGDGFSVAARRNGTVAVWGGSYWLGTPAGLSGVDTIACGRDHVLAIKDRRERASFRTPLTFGPVERTLKLANTGTAELHIASISLQGGNAGDFTLGSAGLPGSLQAGQSAAFFVSFLPSAPGPRQTILRIVTNDALIPVREIALTGLWENSPPVASPVSGLSMAEDLPGGIEITLPASDANGQALTYQIVSPPSAGTLSAMDGNKVTFTPPQDFSGNLSFTFKANDGFSDSNVAAVSLSVEPVEDFPRLSFPSAPWVVQIIAGTGAEVEFPFGAFDGEDGWRTVSLSAGGVSIASGGFFPLGDTVVEVSATDSGGRTSTGSFVVRVVSGPRMVLSVPAQGDLAKVRRPVGWGSGPQQQLAAPQDLLNPLRLSIGVSHSLALKEDGTVVAWGSNTSSQSTVPAGLADVTEIAAGGLFSAALKGDGTVAVWGSNATGYLAPPAGATNVTAIAAGYRHLLALRGDGSVIAWGNNSSGQTTVPTGLVNVVAIAAGDSFSLALKADGTVVGWGSNLFGESIPPPALAGVKKIAAGEYHSLALRSDGSVVAWGRNQAGQVNVPAALPPLKAIAAGNSHSVALAYDGRVFAWGENSAGQILVPVGIGLARSISAGGLQTFAIADIPAPLDLGLTAQGTTSSIPVTVRNEGPGTLDVGGLAFAPGAPAEFSFGTGGMDFQLAPGESTTFTVSFSPVQNGSRSAILRITGNDTGYTQREILLTGTGRNGSPVASNLVGLTTLEDTPITITLPASDPEGDPLSYSIRNLSPANAGSFAPITGNQVVFTPAANFNGNLSFIFEAGDGGTTSNPASVGLTVTPVNDPPVLDYQPGTIRVFTPMPAGVPVSFRLPRITDADEGVLLPLMTHNGSPVQSGSVFAPGAHTVSYTATDQGGVAVDGSFQIEVVLVSGSWLGLESPAGILLPRSPAVVEWNRAGVSAEPPPDLRGVKQISAGADHGFALRNDGTLAGWGSGSSGQLAVPASLTNATKISCGANHTIALRSTGAVAVWGSNAAGQANVPGDLGSVTDVSAGGDFCMARRASGLVAVWGRSAEGQLHIPSNLSGVTAVAAGGFHCLALKSDGTVVCWGSNTYGQASTPSGLSGVTAIAAGTYHSVALRSNGTVAVWGRTFELQSALAGSLNNNIAAISAGAYHTLARKADGSLVAWGSYSPGLPIQPSNIPGGLAGLVSVAGGGTRALAAPASALSLNFGKVAQGSSVTRSITVRNQGASTLSLGSISRLSGSSTQFVHGTSGIASSLPQGQTTTFTITFSATGSFGSRTARFRIPSNDRFETSVEIVASADVVSSYEAWAAAAGLNGTAASSDAEPFRDGLINLVKYAFNLDGSRADHRAMVPGTGTSGLPHVSIEGSGDHSILRLEYLRRRSGGIQYVAERSASLVAGSYSSFVAEPEVIGIDEEWERIIHREPFDPALEPKNFGRVRVTF